MKKQSIKNNKKWRTETQRQIYKLFWTACTFFNLNGFWKSIFYRVCVDFSEFFDENDQPIYLHRAHSPLVVFFSLLFPNYQLQWHFIYLFISYYTNTHSPRGREMKKKLWIIPLQRVIYVHGIENAINFWVWESEWMGCIWFQLDSLGLIQIIIITRRWRRKQQLFREATWKLIGKVRADLKFINR